jgi:hypothetical protein
MRWLPSVAFAGLLFSASVHAHVPADVAAFSHPSQTATGGPVRPKVLTNPANYELRRFGPGLPKVITTAVFWGNRWNDASFAGDRVAGLDSFYKAFDGSAYSSIAAEYADSKVTSPGALRPTIDYQGRVIDSDAVPSDVDLTGASREVCRLINDGRVQDEGMSAVRYFPVFVPGRRPDNTACAVNGYYANCSIRNGTVAAEYFVTLFYDINDDADCNVNDAERVTGHSQALASLANQAGRAISELHSDPYFAGWHDNDGNEIDDKCAWIFDVPFVTLTDGSKWKLQSLWSNQAFESGAGYQNADGEPGCVSSPPDVNSGNP